MLFCIAMQPGRFSLFVFIILNYFNIYTHIIYLTNIYNRYAMRDAEINTKRV